jgi:hypothetical protein
MREKLGESVNKWKTTIQYDILEERRDGEIEGGRERGRNGREIGEGEREGMRGREEEIRGKGSVTLKKSQRNKKRHK